MVKSAVQGPRPPSMTGMEWGSGVCEIASVTRRMGSRSVFSAKWLMERIIKFDRWEPGMTRRPANHGGHGGRRGFLLQGIVNIGFGGTGYQRSLPVTSRAAYNFFNATHPVRDNGISMPEAGTQLTRQSQELMIFHDVAKALTSSLDLDSILQTIMETMPEYFRPDTWSLLMVDEGR